MPGMVHVPDAGQSDVMIERADGCEGLLADGCEGLLTVCSGGVVEVCALCIIEVIVSLIFGRIAVMQASTKWLMSGVGGSVVVTGVGEEAGLGVLFLLDLDAILKH